SALLDAAEGAIAARGAKAVRIMDQPGNYLAPGVDAQNGEVIRWLERRGYARIGENVNLLVDVRGGERVSAERAAALAGAGYELRRARPDEARMLEQAVSAELSPAWAFEVLRALGHEPAGVHVAILGGALAAFAAHDGNNRGLGWFGP